MNDLTQTLLQEKAYEDLYILARHAYRIGNPVIPDNFYDKLHSIMVGSGNLTEYVNRVYDNDPAPMYLNEKYNVNCIQPLDTEEDYHTTLSDEDSMSILPVETYEKAFEWFNSVYPADVVFSLKIDGINTKSILTPSLKFLGAQTRGRGGTSLDINESMSHMFKGVKGQVDGELVVRGEAVVMPTSLDYLRKKYDKPFKIPRSTAMSLLRVPLPEEDMNHLKLIVFKTNLGDTLTQSLSLAREMGMTVVPHMKISLTNMPTSFEPFREWLRTILTKVYDITKHIPSDGVVVQLNDMDAFNSTETKHQYSAGNIALKLEQWKPNIYHSVVKDILTIPNKDKFSFVAVIEPVITSSGIRVGRVNVFNMSIIIKNNINVGQPITFEYKSENSVNLVYEEGK